MTKLIKNWNGLMGLSSNDYYLQISQGSGWVVCAETNDRVYHLSEFAFYRPFRGHYTDALNWYGFDVVLDSWDKESKNDLFQNN